MTVTLEKAQEYLKESLANNLSITLPDTYDETTTFAQLGCDDLDVVEVSLCAEEDFGLDALYERVQDIPDYWRGITVIQFLNLLVEMA